MVITQVFSCFQTEQQPIDLLDIGNPDKGIDIYRYYIFKLRKKSCYNFQSYWALFTASSKLNLNISYL